MQGSTREELEGAFERALDDVLHDREFAQIEVLRHTAAPRRGSVSLFVTIDRPGGADLVLCERVAQRINALLGVIDAAYELSVESAGLERPLVRPTDYERFAGSRVRVVTSLLVGGAKTHRGILRGLRGENVLLETKGGDVLLPHATIKAANLEFDPRADLTAEKRERKGFHGRNHN